MTEQDIASVRIDKWLWHARFFKTRTLAQTQVTTGKVRVNSARVSKANQVRVIEVLAISSRRGPATEAQTLYNDLSPAPAKTSSDDPNVPTPVASRERGAGRPTKRERRITDRLRGN